MASEIVKRLSPEERELGKKQAELANLENVLAELELELATVRSELRIFEHRYNQKVGVLYAELDALEAQIAELEFSFNPDDFAAQQSAKQAQEKAEESAAEANRTNSLPDKQNFKPADTLKKLYREVAKLVHPDLANDEADRIRRHSIMAKVNAAYENSDEAELQNILDEWKAGNDADAGAAIEIRLIRLIRKIALVEDRITAIEIELEGLRTSELFTLYTKVANAEAEGRDLLSDMASSVRVKISAAGNRLSNLKRKNDER